MRVESPLSPEHRRYLQVLGVPSAPPGRALLSRVVAAHLVRCPFENVSKLLTRRSGARRLPTLGEFLDGVERHGLGGTCYVNNPSLFGLLRALGFDCALCGADMDAPDLHSVIVVRLEGRESLVDVGYAAPFFEPLPLDSPGPVRLGWGNDGYVLWPRDAQGRSRLDHLRDGARVHGYVVKPTPRSLDHFEGVIRGSYADAATFMNAVRFERFSPTGSVSLYNDRLRVIEGDRCTFEQLAGRAGIVDALERRLGVSRELAADAVACVPELKGVHG